MVMSSEDGQQLDCNIYLGEQTGIELSSTQVRRILKSKKVLPLG
jgi:hypothetical protein